MADHVIEVTKKLAANEADVRSSFGRLSVEQLNWKPAAESWSVGQCIDHLIKTSEIYSDDFRGIAEGTRTQSWWERLSPLSRFFGKFLTKYMSKDEKKVKTSKRFVPPSDVSENIVEQFTESQSQLQATIQATAEIDWDAIVLTSSFQSVITYPLADAYNIIAEHQLRHIRQAKRVLSTDGFPK